MVPIYICEDNLTLLHKIQIEITKYCMIENLDLSVQLATDNPIEVIQEIQASEQRGIYFLDIDLGSEKMNGFILGTKIRELDPRGYIIYVTTHEELAAETFRYRLEAFDYIYKDRQHEFLSRIQACLSSVQERISIQEKENIRYYTIKVFDQIFHLDVGEIMFIESSVAKHKVCVHMENEQIEYNDILREIETQLGVHFFRCHRSYLVNINNIQYFSKKDSTIQMKNGETCLVSRNKKKKLEQLLEEKNEWL